MNNDLISREALKKAITEHRRSETECLNHFWYDENIIAIIDNAPTVEITEEQAIDKLHETGWLIEHDKEMTTRPQGEWIIVKDEKYGDNVKCPFCGKELAGTDLNFCCSCGADMRGGAV